MPDLGGTPSRYRRVEVDASESDEARRLRADLAADVTSLSVSIQQITESIKVHRKAADDAAYAEAAAVRERAEKLKTSQLAVLRAKSSTIATDLTERATARAHELAPYAASADWDADLTMPPFGTPPAEYIRFGHTDNGVPALAPLVNRTGWCFAGDREATSTEIESLLLRVLAQVSLSALRIRVFDPRIEARFGPLTRLRSADAAAFGRPMHDRADLQDAIAELATLASTNGELIGSRHLRTLGELWSDDGVPAGAYGLLVILNYPMGIDEGTQNALIRLAETGSARGVSLIVQCAEDARPARDVVPEELLRHLTIFRVAADRVSSDTLPAGVEVRPDGAAPRPVADRIVDRAVAATNSNQGPVVALEEVISHLVASPWNESAVDGVKATFGRRGRDVAELDLRSENPPQPNVLIGGAVGQGKSNLLLSIIYSLAARYSPDELEMLLLDFKRGLEFKRFDRDETGRNWLPHAKILSLESSKPFGLAVLEYVSAELERRAATFTDAGCNGYGEYRRRSGRSMPRLLVIIDEFHALFDGDDEVTERAVAVLEEIARQGRAFGVHLLLASQTVSGISGLRIKGDAIFAQFHQRVALKTTRGESEAILARQNTAAADLRYRGEVVVNRNMGIASDGANERALVAYVQPDFASGLQTRLWEKAESLTEPWVFLGRSYSQWPLQPACSAEPSGWIGRPVAVTDIPVGVDFERDVDQTIAVVGTGDTDAAAVLGSICLTAASSWRGSVSIIVLNGDPGLPEWLGVLRRAAGDVGQSVEVVGRDSVRDYLLTTMRDRIELDGPPLLVVAIGLQKVDGLDDEVPSDPDSELAFDTISAQQVLRDVATRGATRNVWLLGWWNSIRGLTTQLGYDHGGVRHFIFLKTGLDDLRSVVGVHALRVTESPRVVVFDRHSGDEHRIVVPFEPITDDVAVRWAR